MKVVGISQTKMTPSLSKWLKSSDEDKKILWIRAVPEENNVRSKNKALRTLAIQIQRVLDLPFTPYVGEVVTILELELARGQLEKVARLPGIKSIEVPEDRIAARLVEGNPVRKQVLPDEFRSLAVIKDDGLIDWVLSAYSTPYALEKTQTRDVAIKPCYGQPDRGRPAIVSYYAGDGSNRFSTTAKDLVQQLVLTCPTLEWPWVMTRTKQVLVRVTPVQLMDISKNVHGILSIHPSPIRLDRKDRRYVKDTTPSPGTAD